MAVIPLLLPLINPYAPGPEILDQVGVAGDFCLVRQALGLFRQAHGPFRQSPEPYDRNHRASEMAGYF